jgi:hypothetical protein
MHGVVAPLCPVHRPPHAAQAAKAEGEATTKAAELEAARAEQTTGTARKAALEGDIAKFTLFEEKASAALRAAREKVGLGERRAVGGSPC